MDKLFAEIKLINDGIKFRCTAEKYPEIVSDYYPPLGNEEGYKPLQLFLISLGTCTGGTILPILRKMRKNIASYEMKVEGIRRIEHPTSFSKIIMEISVQSSDIKEDDMKLVLQKAEEKYCPVWAMIDKSVEIETVIKIARP
jgi:putative redox protein